MAQSIPAQCPDCGSLEIRITKHPPDEHDQGEDWMTRAACEACEEYVAWFD